MIISIPRGIILDIDIVLELDHVKMVFPFKSFFIYRKEQGLEGRFHFGNEHSNSWFGFSVIKSCFDFFINGKKNTIGFKRTDFTNEKCSIECFK